MALFLLTNLNKFDKLNDKTLSQTVKLSFGDAPKMTSILTSETYFSESNLDYQDKQVHMFNGVFEEQRQYRMHVWKTSLIRRNDLGSLWAKGMPQIPR